LIEKGGDWDRRNRLKVYSAIHFLGIRKFKEAADLLLESLSTFTATEVGCDRKGIKTRVCSIE
jgi:26S proteasome regulatory subunit N7